MEIYNIGEEEIMMMNGIIVTTEEYWTIALGYNPFA